MNEPNSLDAEAVRRSWSRYVQSPAQLTLSRLAKFPPNSGENLAESLTLNPGERVLEIGGGMGILAGRLLESGRPSSVRELELDEEYLSTQIPEPLRPEQAPLTVRGDGFRIPFDDGSVDHVVTHTLANLMDENEFEQLHEEIRRVLVPTGRVTHMDGIGGDSWTPDALVPPDQEQERKQRFHELLESVHDRLDTGFTSAIKDAPERLDQLGFDPVNVTVYASALRINDEVWNESEQKLLLELHQRADRDRVERLRNLLEATGGMDADEAQLLRQCVGDVQQQALRRRKALENNRELGWRSSSTLVVTARR